MNLRFPRIVWIVPTTKCNTRCKTCAHFYSQFGQDMSEEVFNKIENEVLDHVKRVHLVGGGEPLVSKLFPRILDACIKRKIKIFFITNTKALTEELTHILVKNDAEIMVSLDGATAATYNHVRPYIKFETLLARLEMIKQIRSTYPGNQFKLISNTVVMKSNLHELPHIIELADKFKIDSAIFSDLIPIPEENFFVKEIPVHYPDLIKTYIPKTISRAKKLDVNFEMQNMYSDILPCEVSNTLNEPNHLSYALKEFIFPQKCHMPWTHANFMVNGDVSACCINSNVLGNLNTEDFEQIWNGKPYKTLRKTINTNNPPSLCCNCNLVDGITGGNPDFFTKFCNQNFLSSFSCEDLNLSGQGHNWNFEIETQDAEFLMLTIKNPKGATGHIRYGALKEKIHENSSKILVPLSKEHQNKRLIFNIDFTAPIEIQKFDLLSYKYKAIGQNKITDHLIKAKFDDLLQLIHNDIINTRKINTKLKTFMVFGANHIGKLIKRDSISQGLIFIGFLDNYISYLDDSPVYEPEALMRIRPDIIIIASKDHALAIKNQIEEITQYHPTIISCINTCVER